ncbi:hypothetical protein PR003_g34652 [Phytophthora rubi]|uniref:Uncharacterized protein n=1 Tax=Phytophthora rubi TaxID=129364 RepID=A0A6A3G4Y7_9STRA|nr:hypothetical protein PR002_g32842 [Phytophthora rubi]KAE9259752.1 hypothetical protein PR003_g34652 [Phytophthora rubi]
MPNLHGTCTLDLEEGPCDSSSRRTIEPRDEAPDDREFPFREIIGERMTPDGPVLKLDWEPSEVPVNHVAPEHVRAFRNSVRNARRASLAWRRVAMK